MTNSHELAGLDRLVNSGTSAQVGLFRLERNEIDPMGEQLTSFRGSHWQTVDR